MKEIIRRGFSIVLFISNILGTAPYFRMGYTQEFLDAFARAKTINITSANKPENFNPHRRLTRQERAKLLIVFSDHYLCLQLKPYNDCVFQDSQKISPVLSDYAQKSCAYGLIKGVNHDFHPTTHMSKAQVLVTLVRALTGQMDETVDPWYANYHAYAFSGGITTVDEIEIFDKPSSRLEALVMLYRARIYKCTSELLGIDSQADSKAFSKNS